MIVPLDLAPPTSPLERLRWGLLGVDVALAMLMLSLLAGRPTWDLPTVAAMAAVVVTVLHWLVAVRRGRLPGTVDVASTVALFLLGVTMGPAEPGMAFAFAAMTIRALYPERLTRALAVYPAAIAVGWGVSLGPSAFLAPPTLITLGAVSLVGLMFRPVVRSMEDHEATRHELRAARDELEDRVAERTEALARANDRLERRVREVQATQTLLKRSEEYYRALIEHASDLVVVLRPDGRIRYHSPAVERTLGYPPGGLRDRSFVEFLEESTIPETLERFNHVMGEPRRTITLMVVARHANGEVRHLEAVASNLVDMPSVGGVVFTSRDVTDRIRMEEALADQEAQLRQAQKMEAVGRLAGGVAHDFNNILTVIGGHAEYLEARLEPGDPLGDEAAGIAAAVDRAGRLTRQLLVFSRREVARPEVLDPNAVVGGVDGLIRRLLPETVRLRAELRSRQWRLVADAGHVEQVILNLVVNARDAMAEGGTLTVATGDEAVPDAIPCRFGEIPPGDYVRISVADTGCGIAEEIMDRIFDPFFTTKGTGGTGLGLSTVFGIAREAGAGIRVESVVGGGSRFDLYFPATAEAPAAAGAEEPTAVGGAGETVLLVEDEDALRSLTARGLRERGYVVLSAANGEDALRMSELYQDPIDLLVSDVVMPGINGPRLHEALEERLGRLPVLFVSGYPGEELSRRGLREERLLPKPYRTAELAAAIREVIDEG